MSPILNSLGGLSARAFGMFASTSTSSANSYESIATTTLGSNSGTITFSSIPSTFKHLQIRYMTRSAVSGNTAAIFMNFNSDSGSNYYLYHELYADGATAAAYAGGAGTKIQLDQIPAANKTASAFAVGIIDLLDYTSTNKNKTVRHLTGYDANGSGAVVFGSGLWSPSSISAITSITLTENSSANFLANSSFALYGVKG
jgi:hypothetical protein